MVSFFLLDALHFLPHCMCVCTNFHLCSYSRFNSLCLCAPILYFLLFFTLLPPNCISPSSFSFPVPNALFLCTMCLRLLLSIFMCHYKLQYLSVEFETIDLVFTSNKRTTHVRTHPPHLKSFKQFQIDSRVKKTKSTTEPGGRKMRAFGIIGIKS